MIVLLQLQLLLLLLVQVLVLLVMMIMIMMIIVIVIVIVNLGAQLGSRLAMLCAQLGRLAHLLRWLGVTLLMQGQVIGSREGLGAVVALEGSVAGVLSLVSR